MTVTVKGTSNAIKSGSDSFDKKQHDNYNAEHAKQLSLQII